MMFLQLALLFAGPLVAERPTITQPSWIQRPTAEDVGRVTPTIELGPKEVRVLMVCRITAAGGLEACSIKEETPPGYGFGEAALKLAPLHLNLFVETSPAPIKYAMSLLGKCNNTLRLPMVPATEKAQAAVREAMVHAGLIN